MAYIGQETKKEIAPAVKVILKKYNMKGTLAIRHNSTLVVNVKSGSLDLLANRIKNNDISESSKNDTYIQVNHYHIETRYSGKCRSFLLEIKAAMNSIYHSGYLNINIGQWDKPYILN